MRIPFSLPLPSGERVWGEGESSLSVTRGIPQPRVTHLSIIALHSPAERFFSILRSTLDPVWISRWVFLDNVDKKKEN